MMIKDITTLATVFSNLKQGDCLFLDIDNTILLCGLNKYEDPSELTEIELADYIKSAQDSGIKVYGFTARKFEFHDQTVKDLQRFNIHLSEIIHAPSISTSEGEHELQKAIALKEHLETTTTKPKRIIIIDDLKEQLEEIEADFKQSDIPVVLYHYIRPEYQAITEQANFPPTLSDFTKATSLGGGTASTFKITNEKTGQHLVLKLGAHPDALKSEILCNALYRTLGVPVPKAQIYNTLPPALARSLKVNPFGIFQVSEYIPEPSVKLPKENLIEQVKKNFVIHALLGNIDVAKEDNFIGTTLIDAGANFLFRAKGEMRHEETSIVSEIESLTNSKINEKAASWFGGLTKSEIKEQVLAILSAQNAIEKTLWDVSAELKFSPKKRTEFLQQFSERLDYLITRFCPETRSSAQIVRKTSVNATAAGILTFALLGDNKEPHILLAKRVRHEWWDNFGGKSENNDTWLYETASREVAEESNNKLNYTHDELLKSPFHDLISEKNGNPFIYRMYIAEHDYVETQQFHDAEHTAYEWVPVQDIINALENNQLVIEENTETIAVQHGDQQILIYPPLYNMLKQPAVLDNIHRIRENKKLSLTHTQSALAVPSPATTNPRLLRSPEEVRQQINTTLINRSLVLQELKHKFKKKSADKIEQASRQDKNVSQSELHLKVMLGQHYLDDNLRANISYALQNKVRSHKEIPTEKMEELIDKLTQLIKTEKKNPDRIYFYHACDEKVAFLYQLYTTMHQILQANEDWFAFRGTSSFFTKFENIMQVIAHYSKNHADINNDDSDFHERMVSANVFLFGNEKTPTSNSLVYLLGNSTRRDIDIRALLNDLLQEFAVPAREIDLLYSLYEKYSKGSGGVLYQMSMSREQAHEMAYAAGCLGVLKQYNGSIDLVEILAKLCNTDGEISEADKKYIENLQARVLVPPHKLLPTKVLRFKDFDAAQSKKFNHSLQTALQSIIQAVLKNHNEFNEDYYPQQYTPILRLQSEIYKVNAIYQEAQAPSEELAKAIIENNSTAAELILNKYPELKTRPISYFQYRNFKTIELSLLPLEMIIHHSKLPIAWIITNFGENWFTTLQIKNLPELTLILQRFSSEDRLSVLKKLNPEEIRQFLKNAEEYQLSVFFYALSTKDNLKIVNLLGITYLKSNIKVLKKIIYTTFISHDKDENIFDLIGLTDIDVLNLVPTVNDLTYFLDHMRQEQKSIFIHALQDRLSGLIKNTYDWEMISNYIDKADITIFFAAVKENFYKQIVKMEDLTNILIKFPDQKLDIYRDFKARIPTLLHTGEDWFWLLLHMDDQKEMLFNDFQDLWPNLPITAERWSDINSIINSADQKHLRAMWFMRTKNKLSKIIATPKDFYTICKDMELGFNSQYLDVLEECEAILPKIITSPEALLECIYGPKKPTNPVLVKFFSENDTNNFLSLAVASTPQKFDFKYKGALLQKQLYRALTKCYNTIEFTPFLIDIVHQQSSLKLEIYLSGIHSNKALARFKLAMDAERENYNDIKRYYEELIYSHEGLEQQLLIDNLSLLRDRNLSRLNDALQLNLTGDLHTIDSTVIQAALLDNLDKVTAERKERAEWYRHPQERKAAKFDFFSNANIEKKVEDIMNALQNNNLLVTPSN